MKVDLMPFQKRPPRDELIAQLKRFKCKVAPVARHFRVSRRAVYDWVEFYGIDWNCDVFVAIPHNEVRTA